MTVAHQKQTSRRGALAVAAASQLDLFAAPRSSSQQPLLPLAPQAPATAPNISAPRGSAIKPAAEPVIARRAPSAAKPSVARKPTVKMSDIRITTVADMPSYSDFDREAVERSLATLPANKVLFTYAAVQDCFGISRATVARRVKEGLVPGIRFRGSNVLEDGAVRRFDRAQLLWLLLAVRARPTSLAN